MSREKSVAELNADLLDVHVVDIVGHIEALVRGTREMQRGILRVRGVPPSLTVTERERAAMDVQQRVARMLKDCDSARDAIREATDPAARLCDLARQRQE